MKRCLALRILLQEKVSGEAIGMWPLLVGSTASFVVGCAACKWMISIVVRKATLVWFAVYCLIVGVLCIGVVNTISPFKYGFRNRRNFMY